MMATVPPPTTNAMVELLAVGAQQLAGMLGLSVRTIRLMSASAKLPRSLKLGGRSVRWALDGPLGIRAWLAAGAPSRSEFEARVKADLASKRR